VAEQGELLSQRQALKDEVGAGLQRSAQGAQQSEYEGHCYAGSLDRLTHVQRGDLDILANDRRAIHTPDLNAAIGGNIVDCRVFAPRARAAQE
jgi:hypothetical protein